MIHVHDLTRRNAGRGHSYFVAWAEQHGVRFPCTNYHGRWEIAGRLPLTPGAVDELQRAVEAL